MATTEIIAEAAESAAAGPVEGGATTAAVVKVMNEGTTSACYGACAQAWPPLLTKGQPKAMGGTEASLLGTTKRKDGTVQVTYNGHPLYGFVEDRKPGETNGNDLKAFGASWYALEPDGEEPADS